MTMAQCEDAKAAQAVDEFTTRDILQQTAFTEPFDHRAFDRFWLRPAIQIFVKVADSLFNGSGLLFRRQLAGEVEVHGWNLDWGRSGTPDCSRRYNGRTQGSARKKTQLRTPERRATSRLHGEPLSTPPNSHIHPVDRKAVC